MSIYPAFAVGKDPVYFKVTKRWVKVLSYRTGTAHKRRMIDGNRKPLFTTRNETIMS